jgi:hypothetical protein
MSIYLKLNEINNELLDKEGRIRQLENGIITDATASNYNITNLLTASTANINILTVSYITASNFSASAGFANLTTLTGSSISGSLILANSLSASDVLISNTLICSGNIRIRSPYGIDFSATSNTVYGTVTSEVFSDYEEGTWTPEISGSTTAGTITYAAGNQGRYTKIGRNIFIQGTVAVSGISAAPVGNINISGLPFTNINLSAPFFISYITGFNTNFNLVNGTVPINARSVQLYKTLDATTNSSTAVTGSDITSTLTLIFSGFLTQ